MKKHLVDKLETPTAEAGRDEGWLAFLSDQDFNHEDDQL